MVEWDRLDVKQYMHITIDNVDEYKKNAIDVLESNNQFDTAKAVEMAFDMLICVMVLGINKEE